MWIIPRVIFDANMSATMQLTVYLDTRILQPRPLYEHLSDLRKACAPEAVVDWTERLCVCTPIIIWVSMCT